MTIHLLKKYFGVGKGEDLKTFTHTDEDGKTEEKVINKNAVSNSVKEYNNVKAGADGEFSDDGMFMSFGGRWYLMSKPSQATGGDNPKIDVGEIGDDNKDVAPKSIIVGKSEKSEPDSLLWFGNDTDVTIGSNTQKIEMDEFKKIYRG